MSGPQQHVLEQLELRRHLLSAYERGDRDAQRALRSASWRLIDEDAEQGVIDEWKQRTTLEERSAVVAELLAAEVELAEEKLAAWTDNSPRRCTPRDRARRLLRPTPELASTTHQDLTTTLKALFHAARLEGPKAHRAFVDASAAITAHEAACTYLDEELEP
jgi:hypothetical protein